MNKVEQILAIEVPISVTEHRADSQRSAENQISSTTPVAVKRQNTGGVNGGKVFLSFPLWSLTGALQWKAMNQLTNFKNKCIKKKK